MSVTLTSVVYREDDLYVSICPELDVASAGETVEEAHGNLREALELFCAEASQDEIDRRLSEGSSHLRSVKIAGA